MRNLKKRYVLHWWTIVHLKNKKMTYKFCNMLWRKTPLVRSSKVSWAGASGNARSCKKYWVNSCLAKFVFYNKRVFLHTGSNCLKIHIYEIEKSQFSWLIIRSFCTSFSYLNGTLQYRIVVQCTLSFLGPKSSPYVLIWYRTFIIFGKKIHPVWLLNTVCLLKLDFFLNFFLDFSTKTSRIFFFLCQFYQFSPFGHRNPKNTPFV